MERKETTISGFMIVKNVVIQGYPFLEAIAAALPVCDEFLVSDGYSTDETWPILKALRKKHPDKLKLFRDAWPGPELAVRGGILAKMTNILKERCRGQYCLNLQANEVLHESCVDEVKALPILYPRAEIFSLPFSTIMGMHFVWMTDFRKRLFRNLPSILSKGDAYDVGYDLRTLLRSPRGIFRRLRNTRGQPCYLSKPVYRYRALFPDNYLAKTAALKDRTYLWHKEDSFAQKAAQRTLSGGRGPDAFWEMMRTFFSCDYHKNLPPGIRLAEVIPHGTGGPVNGCPAIMKHFMHKDHYDIQDSAKALNLDVLSDEAGFPSESR
ncbi:hypothetical protein [Desulfatiglans anilini]|uniref:hypothetical protein n=1 Tax=Desulfatiglans anilini TaxID=90728 RepID=UPI00129464E3|nr:hypothetical protein [Desulfatiglans anilini]